MDRLARSLFLVRRTVQRGLGAGLTLAAGAGFVLQGPKPWVLALSASAIVLVAVQTYRRVSASSLISELEIALALVVGLYTTLGYLEGDQTGRYSAVIFLLVSGIAATCRPLASLVLAILVVSLESFIRMRASADLFTTAFTTRVALIVFFALQSSVILRVETARIKRRARKEVDGELRKLKDQARNYRLVGAGENRAVTVEEKLTRSSVEEIHQSVHYALELLKRTLGLHTAVLLWKNETETHFRISELATLSEDVNDAPIPLGEGVLAVADRKCEIVTVEGLRSSYYLPYYNGPCPVKALAVIPIFDESNPKNPIVRGLLAIDRTENLPFTAEEQALAAQAARHCHRAIQNERVFLQLDRAKIEQGKLYRAAQALGAALTEHEVIEAGVRAAREMASFELSLVTVFDESKKTHEVVAASGVEDGIRDLVGATFRHNTGLVSMVVQNRFPLPYRGDFDADHQVVLSKGYPWPKLPSLLVLPLLLGDRPLGTLVLGSRRRHAFGDSVRSTLEVLASNFAIALSNARMVAKLETMATTDGMTGLLNKRAMIEAATQKIASAKRFGRNLSLLVFDIDFFKKVNDTYGHDVGDVVIKGLGALLYKHKRATDLVARFGGEEFVAVCEQTDESGALLLGERIREELARTVFNTQGGPVSVTCSVGIASLPDAAQDWEGLFKAADESLYVSKRSGRDQCTVWNQRGIPSEIRALSPAPAPVKVARGSQRKLS
jgi:two-component system, cell cycle response regulator